jgi:4a-hydroxytetrahydrobiopterin dehydratase
MGKMPLLTDEVITQRLRTLPGWTRDGDAIHRTFTFKGFPDAVAFVESLVAPAEALNHHPDVDIRYNRVIVTLSTHDSGGLTDHDMTLAARISG